ncbi:Uncharacterised protein [Orientia tsutsugamushi str. Gilliam]|uniref:Uncharacterized protein n=1 Tax=Orientia tsutsugamushi str. Gilliam TaxID=1359184 RepID=A0A2U3QNX9_ORITS|nr:Uncharacterised protein [Orientia tsutsugamushi str. Gilliam]
MPSISLKLTKLSLSKIEISEEETLDFFIGQNYGISES